MVSLCLLTLISSGCFLLFDSDLDISDFGCENRSLPGITSTPGSPFTSNPGTAAASGDLSLYDNGPVTLDPALSAEMSSHTYIVQIYSGLVTLDEHLKPVPDIAERWERSQDGKRYTFYIRRGVRFHDGRAVTAQDIKYSWERACLPATKSQTAGTYLVDIIGAREMISGKAAGLTGLRVVDDYILEVSIDKPKAYFLSKLTYSTAMVVDRNNVAAGGEWWRKPNGTGPFRLTSWTKDQALVLERNERFYGKVPAQVSPELSLSYIGFNCVSPPFDDVKVRRAFNLALNRKRIIAATMNDMVTPARGILPPGMPGYNENIGELRYDPVEAKKLLSESKYAGKMPPVTLDVSGWGNAIPDWLGAAIQDWRVNLGVEVLVRQLEPEDYLYSIRHEKDQMYVSGWIADYPDPQNFLDLLFRSGEENNVGEFSDTEIDNLFDRAAVESDEEVRYKLYREAERDLIDLAATLPMWHNINFNLIKPYVKEFSINAVGIPTLSQVSVSR